MRNDNGKNGNEMKTESHIEAREPIEFGVNRPRREKLKRMKYFEFKVKVIRV